MIETTTCKDPVYLASVHYPDYIWPGPRCPRCPGSRCEAGEGVLLQWPWILQITPESSVLTPPMLTPLTPAQCFNNPCHIRYLKLYEEAVSSQGRLSPDLWLAAPPAHGLWLVTAGLSSAPGSWNVKIYARLAPSPGTRVGMLFYPALGGATRLIQTEISSKIWRITQTWDTVTSLHLGGHTSLATRWCGGLACFYYLEKRQN